MIKVFFVKPVWLFFSGDQAFVPVRVARWLTSTGYAYTSQKGVLPPSDDADAPPSEIEEEPPVEDAEVPPPLRPEEAKKKLTTRKKHSGR
jgi:hypothetical protein